MNILPLLFAAGLASAGAAQAQDPQALLNKYNCQTCHANDEAKTGPAFADIAAKYRGNPKAAATLRAVVKGGEHGGGPWHMPPFPEIPEADAEKIVRYILSLRP